MSGKLLNFKGLFDNKSIALVIAPIISAMACVRFLELRTSNIFALLFIILFYFLYKQSFEVKDKKIKIVSGMLGALYTASFVLYKFEELFNIQGFYRYFFTVVYVIGFYLIFSNTVTLIYSKILNYSLLKEKSEYSPKKSVLIFLISMAVMLLAWLPYFLRNFPGDITTDSNNQLLQATGLIPYSNAHPIVHTVFVKLFYGIGFKLFGGNQTLAVATYSVCQAILLSATFSYLILSLYKMNFKYKVLAAILALFAFLPYHAVYSITLWKDIWFGAIILLFTITVWRILEHYNSNNVKFPITQVILLAIFGLAMCLFRSNGLYAYVVLVPFLFFIFRKKSICIALIAVIILPMAFLIKGPLMSSVNISQSDTIESLSIPAQHIARAICDGAKLTKEQEKLLSQVVDISEIPNRYTPHVSDPIKNLVRETDNQDFIDENKGKFLKLWISLGLKYPSTYIKAQVDQTYGYWYPDVQYWVYAPEFINRDMEFVKDTKLSEGLYEFYTDCMSAYKDIPVLGLFWSIGAFSWLALFSMGLCFLKKDKSFLVVYIPVLAVLATLIIATPVYAEFRYAYSLFTTLPLLFVIPFAVKSKKEIAGGGNK